MNAWLSVVRDALSEAWGELWRGKLRTVLALIGIALGAAALVFMASVYLIQTGAWMEAHQQDWVSVTMLPLRADDTGRRRARLKRDHLVPADAQAIRSHCPSVERLVISGTVGAGLADCKAGREAERAQVMGTDAVRVEDLERAFWQSDSLAWGRMFTPEEIAGGNRVAIISDKVREELFHHDPLDGAAMRVGGVKFKVIGAASRPRPHPRVGDIGIPAVLMPYSCLNDLYGNVTWDFHVLPKRGQRTDAVRSIDEVLRSRIGDPGDSFVFWNGKPSAQDLRGAAYLGLIGFLTMLSAGFAVSNKMYMDVLERVNHIAMRRALGATAGRIYGTVLLEGVLLSTLGSIIGGGIGAASFRAAVLKPAAELGWTVPLQLSLLPLLAMLAFAVTLGIAAALQAAAVAVRANPAEALTRKEVA